ncbi:FAD:protein FMN transferase [Pareuzebyella sediminis]|uniref:FAD:protein FMN transferase n=1 Tax=Pareuzebyella sediminis TaxID=2607998 RepID=UPI0011EC52DF|nr:FAD:protein FMN transferase [Pareuzebyella sediminis]
MNRIILALLGLLMVSCTGKQPELVRNQIQGGALGTSYSLIYLTHGSENFQKEIDSVFTAVNGSLSTYIPTSDISKINRGDTTVVVDAMFSDVFQLSKQVFQSTHGYFDPTVGVLVNAWGFGPGTQIAMDSTRVDSLLDYVGFDKVILTKDNTLKKESGPIYLDFNAIAKGYTIDRLARLMDTKGIENYLLEVGGELVAKGENRIKEKPWVVGIDDPQMGDTRQLKKTLFLKDRAMASSGNYRKFRVDSLTGKRYVHTINPKTGFTKNSNTLAATVIADNCAKADAYATAFMAMDLDDALKLLTSMRDLEAYIIYLDEQGDTQEFMTPGFEKRVVKR